MIKQDLHIHTTFSKYDGAVVPEQTLELISMVRHAGIIGISDHYEAVCEDYEAYRDAVRSHHFYLGTEVDGYESVQGASQLEFDYYFYHCRDDKWDYKGIDILLTTGKTVIISHPLVMGTNLHKVPNACFVELNNRYLPRNDWLKGYSPFKNKFRFVLSSDAHQPHWLNQNFAKHVAKELGIEEKILF